MSESYEEKVGRLKEKGCIPAHVAVIMDGNGRWARARNLPRVAGHKQGVSTVRMAVEESARMGIRYLTLYTFSTENWRRPIEEVSALMKLLIATLNRELDELNANNVRLRIIGDLTRIPGETAAAVRRGIESTASNTGLQLIMALNYGSREEIVRAVRSLAAGAAEGGLKPEEITGESIAARLYTADVPDPDLLIRTSGEMRVSNFLLWQLAYTEFYITDVLWPDFSRDDFLDAVEDYCSRDRRFGRVNG